MQVCLLLLYILAPALAFFPSDPIHPLDVQLIKLHRRPPTDDKGILLPIDYSVKITSTFLNSLDTASLSLSLWLVEQFHNPSLGWSLEEYPQTAIAVTPLDIYIPSLRSCAGGRLDRALPSEILVGYDGLVTIRSEAFLTTMCRPSYDRYPYDQNICSFCFETQRAGTQAALSVDLSECYLKGTPEVQFLADLTVNESYTYVEGNMSVAEVRIDAILQRNPTVIMLMIFLPALLLYIEIFLVLRFPDIEEFKMLLEGTSVYATLNLAIVEVLARTNSLPGLGIGKYTSGSQVVLLILSLLFVSIRYWGKTREERKQNGHLLESCFSKRYGVQRVDELLSSTHSSPLSFSAKAYRRYFKLASKWAQRHREALAIAIVSVAALGAPIALSWYSFK